MSAAAPGRIHDSRYGPLKRNVPWSRLGLLWLGLLTAGCVDERIVFERDLFDPPPDSTNNFLGYFDRQAKLTVCGNCHVGQQSQWEASPHADAWATLQATPGAQAFCEGCHAISENGNPVTGPAGINLVRHERYYDVQCESCHGPGLTHVENPDATQPLAALSVTPDVGCGECHQGTHHPFVEQWSQSRHGTVPALASVGTNATCLPCHEGKRALTVKFGETADYVEKASATGMPITCGVCHDPHGSEFEANLRADITAPTLDNFCVKCHARRATPPSSHGPHAPQGFLVLGENVGWIPPDFNYDTTQIASSHGTEANPRLCATCHVPRFDITDELTGEFLLTSVGHTFEAIPCPTDPVTGLPEEMCNIGDRNFSACGAGCHSDVAGMPFRYQTLIAELNNLLDQVWEDVNGDHVMDPAPTDQGVLPGVLAANPGDTTILDIRNNTTTIAEGALWNALLAHTSVFDAAGNQLGRPYFGDGAVYVGLAGGGAGIHIGAQKGSGNGVHNPFLLKALLLASIDAVEAEYGVTALKATPVSLTVPPGVTQLR